MDDRRKKSREMSDRRRSRMCVGILAFFLSMSFAAGGTVSLGAPDVRRADEQKNAEGALPEDVGELYAKSAVLMDADSGRVLTAKDGNTMRPMASTTKILTCIIALEEGNGEDTVTASGEAASQPKVHLGMTEGEQFALKDLLRSLMLESHNDSAVAIAEHLAGSVPTFAAKMNEKAEEIGCVHAHFVTPNGLDSSDEGGAHSISAADLALIMSYCIRKSPKAEEFLEITQTASYSFTDREGRKSFSCTNHNQFLSMMEGAISGKTGFTGDAGYCYVGALERDGRTFAVALLACGWPNNKNYKWSDTKRLMSYALEHYAYRNVWQEPSLKEVPVENGIASGGGLFDSAKTAVRTDTEEEELRVLLGDAEEVNMTVTQTASMEAPVEEGEMAGTITYSIGEQVLKEYPLVTVSAIEERTAGWYLKKVVECWSDFSACEAMLK